MTFQDMPYGVITDEIPLRPQGAGHAIITSGATLLGHTSDQGFHLLLDLVVAERPPLPIAEPHTALDLLAEDSVICHQILVA
jgi:hypothetical protein